MNFRTEVCVEKHSPGIEHKDKIFFAGSCFAENIYKKFKIRKFNCMLNPFGILYNPASLLSMFMKIADDTVFSESDLFKYRGLWHSYDHHSDFSAPTAAEALEKINSSLQRSGEFLSDTKLIIISLGTAFVFEEKSSGKIVGNCHKLPADKFTARMLSPDEVERCLDEIIQIINKYNSGAEILFTVSPVRHWKNGAHGNQLSKSALLLGVDSVVKKFSNVSYFPSYELLLDDLRDYRFYADDLLHPNSQAVDYIWWKFSESWLSAECREAAEEIWKIAEAANHRPRFTGTEETRKFAELMLSKINKVSEKYSYVDFTTERGYFSRMLNGGR